MSRSDSKSSAPVAPRAVKTRAPIGLTVVPSRRQLSDGTLVEASILVRVLGIRLLTLGATVVLVPAEATVPSSLSPHPQGRTPRPERRTPNRSNGIPPARSGAVGHRLAEAVRSIDEGAEALAEARRQAP